MVKKVEEALTDYAATHQADITAHPDSPTARVDEGWSHLSRGEVDQAVTAFEKALSLDRQSLDAMYGLGAAANAKGDKARARQAFERVLELAASSDDIARAKMMSEMAKWALKRL